MALLLLMAIAATAPPAPTPATATPASFLGLLLCARLGLVRLVEFDGMDLGLLGLRLRLGERGRGLFFVQVGRPLALAGLLPGHQVLAGLARRGEVGGVDVRGLLVVGVEA